MVYLIVVVAGLAFGAADQYLGTIRFGPWAWTVSGMSAPWLVLPFVVGITQERSRRATAFGLVVTMSALVGYFAMTHSPLEGAPLEEFPGRFLNMVTSGYNPLWIVAGLVTGPLYGFLGHRWHMARSWISAVLVTSALCFEPLARGAVGMLSPQPYVWAAEVAIGIIAGVFFIFLISQHRREMAPLPPTA